MHIPLPTILLVWGGFCLSQIYCAPVSHDSAIEASGSDVQLAKLNQRDETSQLDITKRIPTSVPTNPSEMDIHVLGSPPGTSEDQTPVKDGPDGNEMFKYWFGKYIEFVKWLGDFATWLWQQALPLALFLAACGATISVCLVLVTAVLGCLASAVSDGPTERTRLL